MSLVSSAQNLEDVILWRALHDVGYGFYIDVGANDPFLDSVTYLFYRNGWSGIDVDANRGYYDLLKKERPRDVVLNLAVTNYDGRIVFFNIDGTGISTTEEEIFNKHAKNGYVGVPVDVECATLASICSKYVSGDIHFMKIDVEGGTRSVLEGMDFKKFRPWVVVCEAVRPNTRDSDFEDWEDVIINAEYSFVYEDGLNRFYLASERAHLKARFRYPPNVFDGFHYGARHDILTNALNEQRDVCGRQIEEMADRLAKAETDATGLQAHVADLTFTLDLAEADKSKLQGLLEEQSKRLAEASQACSDLDSRIRKMEDEYNKVGKALEQSQRRLTEAERDRGSLKLALEDCNARLAETTIRNEKILSEVSDRAARAEARAAQFEGELRRTLASLSWRVTAPLRLLGKP